MACRPGGARCCWSGTPRCRSRVLTWRSRWVSAHIIKTILSSAHEDAAPSPPDPDWPIEDAWEAAFAACPAGVPGERVGNHARNESCIVRLNTLVRPYLVLSMLGARDRQPRAAHRRHVGVPDGADARHGARPGDLRPAHRAPRQPAAGTPTSPVRKSGRMSVIPAVMTALLAACGPGRTREALFQQCNPPGSRLQISKTGFWSCVCALTTARLSGHST